MMALCDRLERLSNAFGPSGRERDVRALLRAGIAELADRIEVDALGNLIAYKTVADPEPRLRVMLSAHMDEVGFMITEIQKNGVWWSGRRWGRCSRACGPPCCWNSGLSMVAWV